MLAPPTAQSIVSLPWPRFSHDLATFHWLTLWHLHGRFPMKALS